MSDDEDDPFGGGPAVTPLGPDFVRMGRPSDYCEALVDKVIEAIMGGKTLQQITETEGLPHKATILRWAARYPEFETMLEKAFEWRTRLRCDEIIDIVDNSTGDFTLDPGDENSLPVLAFKKTHVVRAALQMKARLEIMARENPKRYGINQPRPQQPALEAPRNPEDAKDVTAQTVIEVHPLATALQLRSPVKPGE